MSVGLSVYTRLHPTDGIRKDYDRFSALVGAQTGFRFRAARQEPYGSGMQGEWACRSWVRRASAAPPDPLGR